jgi:hypothetical protein
VALGQDLEGISSLHRAHHTSKRSLAAGEHELKGVPDRWHLYRVVS